MRILLLMLLAAPYFALARTANKTPPRVCWFSKKIGEHQAITRKGCQEKLCNHQIACGTERSTATKPGTGKFAQQVVIKAKNGSCDGYTADEALALANSVLIEADFLTAPAPASK